MKIRESSPVFVLLAMSLLTSGANSASGTKMMQDAHAKEAQIKRLADCYATGADVIANSKSDQETDDGIQVLRRCFTDDSEVIYQFKANMELISRPPIRNGPEGFAKFVRDTVARSNYSMVKHVAFNMRVDLQTNVMKSSGLGYHWKLDGTLVLVPFTFEDQIVFDREGKPKIQRRTSQVLFWQTDGLFPPPPSRAPKK